MRTDKKDKGYLVPLVALLVSVISLGSSLYQNYQVNVLEKRELLDISRVDTDVFGTYSMQGQDYVTYGSVVIANRSEVHVSIQSAVVSLEVGGQSYQSIIGDGKPINLPARHAEQLDFVLDTYTWQEPERRVQAPQVLGELASYEELNFYDLYGAPLGEYQPERGELFGLRLVSQRVSYTVTLITTAGESFTLSGSVAHVAQIYGLIGRTMLP